MTDRQALIKRGAIREDTNRHGIPRKVYLKPPAGARKCTVPWVREGGGVKSKRAFKSKVAAERFLRQHSKVCRGLQSYPCEFHKWHIGHPPKPKKLCRFWWFNGKGHLLYPALSEHLFFHNHF